MNDPIVLQWTPQGGPREKLTIKQTDDGWIRIEAQWDGCQWQDIDLEQITNPTVSAPDHDDSDPKPRTLSMILEQLDDVEQYHRPMVGVFETPAPILITRTSRGYQYHTEQCPSGHSITTHSLRQLTRRNGLPTTALLTETPYVRETLYGDIQSQ